MVDIFLGGKCRVCEGRRGWNGLQVELIFIQNLFVSGRFNLFCGNERWRFSWKAEFKWESLGENEAITFFVEKRVGKFFEIEIAYQLPYPQLNVGFISNEWKIKFRYWTSEFSMKFTVVCSQYEILSFYTAVFMWF